VTDTVRELVEREYQYGFSTPLDTEIVDDVEVTLVVDPAWTVERIPMEVRLELGLL
jgi:metal-sulfur cluster biosynthetic enzyme